MIRARGIMTGMLVGALGSLLVASQPANALPKAPMGVGTAAEESAVQPVHYRGWRHCHWRNGNRYCHGGRRSGYWGGPRFSIDIGPGWGRRHHRDWDGHRGYRGRHRD